MVLMIGIKGQAVKEYQQRLHDLGYAIGVDGIFGLQTLDITKRYQRDNGLIIDGIAGLQTLGCICCLSSGDGKEDDNVKYVVGAGGLNLRNRASVHSPLLRIVRQGEMCEYLGESSGIYHRVRMDSDGLEGYGWSKRLALYTGDTGQEQPKPDRIPRTEHFIMAEWETRCKITDKLLYPILQTLMNALELLRKRSGGREIVIHSGYRTKKYHQHLNPGTNSMHCYAGAADISFGGDTSRKGMHEIGVLAKELYDEGVFGGLGLGNSCVHVDVRGRKDANGNTIRYDNLRAMWFYNRYKNYKAWFDGTN